MQDDTPKLTLDTYGHLFPGQGADVVEHMRGMLNNSDDEPRSPAATATEDAVATAEHDCSAQQLAQH
ncbi:MAG: hypothetical protein KatS3mg111_4299 [Pirellulaceae bacterium]|nr:MAG: hypothetical protein KatS3mg111_4299 [Pirellulaceae bacterium]